MTTITLHSPRPPLVRIEPGSFLMGSTKDQIDQLMRLFPDSKRERFDDEQPRHPVKITRPFFLGIHEVTVGQFRSFVEQSGHQTEAEKDGQGSYVWNETKETWELDPGKNWRNPGFSQTDDYPVVCVSHNDAMAFCRWLSQKEGRTYRLPTEAEWEFACRAGMAGLFPWGDDIGKQGEHVWFNGNSDSKTHPVGQKHPNAWGLYDMLGNVREWCADWYDEKYYASSPSVAVDPPGPPKASCRVYRGGGWDDDADAVDCRPACRDGNARGTRTTPWASAWPQTRNELGTEPRSAGRTGAAAEPPPVRAGVERRSGPGLIGIAWRNCVVA